MIKQFFSIMRRYIKPYRKYLAWSVILNFLSQWLNVFSFTALVPILNILFQTKGKVYEFQEIHGFDKDAIINNDACLSLYSKQGFLVSFLDVVILM